MIKNKRKTLSIFYIILISMISISSLMFLLFDKRVTSLTYLPIDKSISIIGETKQYGKVGSSGKTVKCEPKTGYIFKEWSDGYKERERIDVFPSSSKTIIANTDFAVKSIPSLSLVENNKSINYISTEEVKTGKYNYFNELNSFYSKKGIVKPDYYFKSKDFHFDDHNKYTEYALLSLNVDKTMLRQTLYYDLFNEMFDGFKISYNYVNLYINYAYSGMYLLVQIYYPDDCAFGICEHDSGSDKSDFTFYGKTSYVNYNPNNLSIESIKGIVEKCYSNKALDIYSFSCGYALHEIFKNSSTYQDSFAYYVTDKNTIKYYPTLTSFSLSLGLWRWLNYEPSGHFYKNHWLSLFENYFGISDANDLIKKHYTRIVLLLDEKKSFVDTVSDAILLNSEKWKMKAEFGSPDETIGFSNYDENYNYLSSFIHSREEWIGKNF